MIINTKTYAEIFSPAGIAKSIEEDAFPCTKRLPALKCTGRSSWSQIGSQAAYINEGEDPETLKNRSKLTQQQVEFYKTPEGIVALNKNGISLAIDRRVSLFFHQAILCYKMPFLTFSAKGASDQIGTSSAIKLSSGASATTHKREAAHSSTIPTLLATEKNNTSKTFIYLKGGSGYSQHNATIGMNIHVNGADELIDGKGDDNKLRALALKILNETAEEKIDPIDAAKKFIEVFDKQVLAAKKDLLDTDPRKAILQRYHEKIEKVRNVVKNTQVFDKLLGVVIPQGGQEQALRNLIFKKRYDIIRFQEVIECRIGKRIYDVKNTLGRSPPFELVLLKACSVESERKILEKLFCKTAAVFEADYKLGAKESAKALKSLNTQIDKFINNNKTELDGLLKNINQDVQEMISAEMTYQSEIFRELRKINKWSKKKFCEEYGKTTKSQIQEPSVTFWEKKNHSYAYDPKKPRNKGIFRSMDQAARCAKTFGVPVGLFFPELFTS